MLTATLACLLPAAHSCLLTVLQMHTLAVAEVPAAVREQEFATLCDALRFLVRLARHDPAVVAAASACAQLPLAAGAGVQAHAVRLARDVGRKELAAHLVAALRQGMVLPHRLPVQPEAVRHTLAACQRAAALCRSEDAPAAVRNQLRVLLDSVALRLAAVQGGVDAAGHDAEWERLCLGLLRTTGTAFPDTALLHAARLGGGAWRSRRGLATALEGVSRASGAGLAAAVERLGAEVRAFMRARAQIGAC